MKLIRKNNPPSSFTKYIKDEFASFEEMDKKVKDDLRLALNEEQYGICAYCQQKLKSLEKTKIEHHCEQTICNGEKNTQDRRLDYMNLLLVFPGEEGIENKLHCDTSKAAFNVNSGLPIKISPLNNSHVTTISYSSTGLIRSSNKQFHFEMGTILNLNLDYIKDLRKRKSLNIFRNSKNKNGAINKDKMKKLLDVDLTKKEGNYINNFPGLSEYMKSKYC